MENLYKYPFLVFLLKSSCRGVQTALLLLLLLFASLYNPLLAQNTPVRVTVQVLPPYSNNIYDYLGSEEQMTRRFQEQVLITVQNTSPSQEYEIKLLGSVIGDNGLMARMNESYQPVRGIVLAPGELKVMSGTELAEINRLITENDVSYQGITQEQIVRTGKLPEGNYRVCMQVFDFRTAEPLSSSEPMGCSPPIPIAYPDPPVIAFPFDGAEVIKTTPQAFHISWAPSPGLSPDIRYRFRMVEVNELQANPYDLLENTRISFYEEDNILTTNLFYDQTKPPLKEGATYAIRVQAYDPFGQLQIKNNGLSEIHLFKYVPRIGKDSPNNQSAALEYIELEPGFLRLVQLEKLQAEQQGEGKVYRGAALLEIRRPGQEPDYLTADVLNLSVTGSSPGSTQVISGSVGAKMDQLPQALEELQGLMKVETLGWEVGAGLAVSGSILGPDGKEYPATGSLQITLNGVYGEVTARSDPQNPFYSFGERPVELQITEISITFPGAQMISTGKLLLFGEEGLEQSSMASFSDLGSGKPANIHVQLNRKIPLMEGSEKFGLYVKNVFGELIPDPENLRLDYHLEMISQLGVENLDQNSCGLDLMVGVHSDKEMEVRVVGSNCIPSQSTIPLGPAILHYANLTVDQLDYNPETNQWSTELSLDGQLIFPVFGNFTTPVLEDLKLNEKGLQLPSMSFQEGNIQQQEVADWEEFLVTLTEFVQGPITLPLFKVEKIGPGDWDYGFRAKAAFADEEGVPECLRGSTLDLTGGQLGGEQMMVHIDPENMGGCQWDFGAGYAINLNSIEGIIAIQFGGWEHQPLLGKLNLDFDFLFGQPFACEGEEQVEVLDSEFSVKVGLTGTVEDLVPPCPLVIGPFSASVTQSKIDVGYIIAQGPYVTMSGEAKLDYKNLNTSGTFRLDMMTGEFTNLSFKINQPFILDLPAQGSVLSFQIEEAEISEKGLFIDGRNDLLLEGQKIRATFDNLLVDINTNQIKSGSIIFDNNFAFEANIDQNNSLQFKAVPFDHSLTASPALLMQLAGTLQLDSTGIHSNGTARASIHFDDLEFDSLTAVYKDDFRLGFYPFGIRNGQVDFFYKEQRVAYADASGFHPDYSSLGQAFIPELIALPTEEIAYIRIKKDNQLLVNIGTDQEGNTLVSTKPGQPLQLVIPALQNQQPQPPSVAVELNQLVLKSNNGEVVGGYVMATIPENDPAFDLEKMGIPFQPHQIAFGANSTGEKNLTALFLKGSLRLFNKDLGPESAIVLGIQSDGHLRASFDQHGLQTPIPLLENSEQIKITFSRIHGTFDIPLLSQSASPDYDIWFDSNFMIENLEQKAVAKASISGHYQPDDFTITSFDSSVDSDSAKIELDAFSLQIDEISSLDLSYSPESGVDFTAALDCSFGFTLANGEEFIFPLKNIEINKHDGIIFPAQDIHDGSFPGFSPPEVDFGVFHLKPIAFRLPAITFNWYSWQPGDALAFLPKIDLELSFPDLQYSAPEFSQVSLTLQDIGFEDGYLTGTLLPFTFEGDGAALPLGGELSLNVTGIGGSLFPAGDGSQGITIDLEGKLHYPDFFPAPPSLCIEPEISLSMNQEAHFSGFVQNFTPCGQFVQGPLSLQFTNSLLEFRFQDNHQEASLSGAATAAIERANQQPVIATGNIAMNLISGELISGSILLTGPFDWAYPEENSLFSFTVQTAKIDTAGLVFNGNGSLALGNRSSAVSFQDLTFDLSNGNLTRGSARIQNSFALDVGLNPTQWSLEDPEVPSVADQRIRLVMPPDLLLDQNGLTVNKTSTASLYYGDQTFDLLSVFFDEFTLGVDPVNVRSGVANLYLEQGNDPVRIAYYDQTGFHLDDGTNLIQAVLSDTLYLPSPEVAYIVLRDPNGNFLVDVQAESAGKKLTSTSPLRLAITAFDSQNPILMQVYLQEVYVNDAFEVIKGSIEADVSANPIDLSPIQEIPLHLRLLRYEKWNNQPFALYADASLKLPPSLQEVEVNLQQIKFGPGGFAEGLIAAGTYAKSYQPNIPAIAQHAYENGAFRFAVTGVELDFKTTGNSYRLSGNIGSTLFRDAANTPSLLHFSADYTDPSGWNFTMDVHHLPNMEIPLDQAKLALDNLEVNMSGQNFELVVDGRLTFREVMGDDFEVGLYGLAIGSQGIHLNSINSNALQYLSLFNEVDNVEIKNFDVSLQNQVLFIVLDGSLHFLERYFSFTALKVGTNGSLTLGDANANLLNQELEILGPQLVLQRLNLTTFNSKIALEATGEVNLPEPFVQSQNNASIRINYLGETEVNLPSLSVSEIPPADLGGFARLKLTDIGIHFDPMNLPNSVFFASADLEIPDDGNGSDNIIQFGIPNGDYQQAGISYRYGDSGIRWKITNSPSFTFDQSFFKISISGAPMVADGGTTFGVILDGWAQLQFEEVGGGGGMEDIRIDANGITWGTFSGASFTFTDFVNIEVGTFEYFDQGGTIEIERKDGTCEGPEGTKVVVEQLVVDEYLGFYNSNGNALSVSIGDPEGFAASGGIEEILYYRKGDELVFQVKQAHVQLSDFAKLNASMEYKHDPSGYLLRVAGGASISPPGGQEIGVVAVGKLATINNQFSMGIFVATKGIPVPIIPAIIEINKFGGGFFYHAESQDLDMVLGATQYEPFQEVPWQSSQASYDFAVLLYGGVGIIGGGGSGVYTFTGDMLMVVTDEFIMMDSRFEMNTAPFGGGAYFMVEFSSEKTVVEAGGALSLHEGLVVVEGGVGVNFTAVKNRNSQKTLWAFTGGTEATGGKPIKVLSFLEVNANVIVNNDGFLLDCRAGGGFDVWLISVNGNIEMAVWYLSNKSQFGAYAEIMVNASILGGLASLEGTATGALIIDRGDFILFASLTGRVEVIGVFDGEKTIWLAISNGGIDGGTGGSDYEDLIAAAREQARNMNEKATELLASIEDAKNTIAPLSNEELTQAGLALFMASQEERQDWGKRFIKNEEQLMNPTHPVFYGMRDEIVDGNRPEDEGRAQKLQKMKQEVQKVNDNAEDILEQLQELKASAISWQQTAGDMMANLQDPVQQKNTEWLSDEQPPSFHIDTVRANQNVRESSSLKEKMEKLNKEIFQAAIDTTLTNIRKIEAKLDGRAYTLLPSVQAGSQKSVLDIARMYQEASYQAQRYYSSLVSYFWALHHWAKTKEEKYADLNSFYNDGLLNEANKQVLNSLGIVYSGYDGPLAGSWQNMKDANSGSMKITIGGIQIVDGYRRTDDPAKGWNDLSSSQKQAFKGGLKKSIEDIARAVGYRRGTIFALNPHKTYDESYQAFLALEESIKNSWADNRFREMIIDINISSEEFYKMQLYGLREIKETSLVKADSLVEAADQLLFSLDAAHQEFTHLQDEIYQIKASMITTLYGMYDFYGQWAKTVQEDELAGPIQDKLSELELMLTPPKFNSISYLTYKGDYGYDRQLWVGWDAYHPFRTSQVGMVESSYQVQGGIHHTIYGSGFKSLGNQNTVVTHTYARSAEQTKQDYTIRIRARGPAGNSITRFLHSTIELTPDAAESTQNIQALVPDNTPPSAPIATLAYHKNNPNNSVTSEKYWSNNQGEIAIQVVASDNESDIAKIEYAIGSSKGGTDVVNWKAAPGTSFFPGQGNNSFSNSFQKVSALGLNLQPGKDYYVSVRVTNGAGLSSAVTAISTPLRLDLGLPLTTAREIDLSYAPVVVSNEPSFVIQPGQETAGTAYQENYVTEVPKLSPPPAQVSAAKPRIEAKWQETIDTLSGIRGYEYVLGNIGNPSMALAAGKTVFIYKHNRSIIRVGDPLSFQDTTFVHVWAQDYAGNRSSKPLTFSLIPTDPSAPLAPQATIMGTPEGLRLYLIKPSFDPESGIKGVQYTIGTSPGGTEIKGWPAGNETDQLEMDAASAAILKQWLNAVEGKSTFLSTANMPDAPSYRIPTTLLKKGWEGVPLYIQYRTVNLQGKKSAIAHTGPVVLDTSAPPSPTVTLSMTNGYLKISAANIQDKQSGVRKVEYKVIDKTMPETGIDYSWKEFTNLNSISRAPFSASKSILSTKALVEIMVGIRITNGNGMQTTYWFDGQQYFTISVVNATTTPSYDSNNFNINW